MHAEVNALIQVIVVGFMLSCSTSKKFIHRKSREFELLQGYCLPAMGWAMTGWQDYRMVADYEALRTACWSSTSCNRVSLHFWQQLLVKWATKAGAVRWGLRAAVGSGEKMRSSASNAAGLLSLPFYSIVSKLDCVWAGVFRCTLVSRSKRV